VTSAFSLSLLRIFLAERVLGGDTLRSLIVELLEPPPFFAKPKRLLDVSDVAEWLGVSKGWIRDHASGRRQPRLFAIKLGPAKGKGLWKFREEDVHQFIQDQRRR